MSFISPEYVIFFCTVIPFFFWLPHRHRWLLLLITSYFFYGYGNVQYVPLLIFTTLTDYTAAVMIQRSKAERSRRLWLCLSLGMNLGVLFFFKYFNFFNASAANVLGVPPVLHHFALPIGISFYTFQSMAYVIDVFRRYLDAEPDLGIMATFVVFFPQLVAGPIERAPNLLPQFHVKHFFNEDRTVAGLQLILWGFFKKVVIADRMAIYVNAVYNNVESHSGLPLLLATFFFAFQIYCDFSGYSDIAIGTAKIMGFDLMDNFRQPYLSQSIREFWARWHISLSTWFRDYLYIPLGGNRVSLPRNLLNLFIVFVVSGLWHGAGWTFVIWGVLHGLGVVLVTLLHQTKVNLMPGTSWWMVLMRVIITFIFVDFAWIFFRANSFADAQYIVSHLFVFTGSDIFAPFEKSLLSNQIEFYLSFALIGFLIFVDYINAHRPLETMFARMALIPRWSVYWFIGAVVIFSGLYGSGAGQFIYFQF
jgi:alginate O-acetyltransferase complex protein AlgI